MIGQYVSRVVRMWRVEFGRLVRETGVCRVWLSASSRGQRGHDDKRHSLPRASLETQEVGAVGNWSPGVRRGLHCDMWQCDGSGKREDREECLCVVRGDHQRRRWTSKVDRIQSRIGDGVSIGDNVLISNSIHLPEGIPTVTLIGNNTIVGAGSILTSNIIDADCVIGENCLLKEGALMEAGSSLGTGSVLSAATCVPGGQHWAGNPATYQGPAKTELRQVHRYVEWLWSDESILEAHRDI